MTRQEAIAVLESDAEYMYSQDSPYNREAYQMAINALQAVPVKHGKWIGKPVAGYSTVRCSVCKEAYPENMGRWNYCPNCGAKMDEVKEWMR